MPCCFIFKGSNLAEAVAASMAKQHTSNATSSVKKPSTSSHKNSSVQNGRPAESTESSQDSQPARQLSRRVRGQLLDSFQLIIFAFKWLFLAKIFWKPFSDVSSKFQSWKMDLYVFRGSLCFCVETVICQKFGRLFAFPLKSSSVDNLISCLCFSGYSFILNTSGAVWLFHMVNLNIKKLVFWIKGSRKTPEGNQQQKAVVKLKHLKPVVKLHRIEEKRRKRGKGGAQDTSTSVVQQQQQPHRGARHSTKSDKDANKSLKPKPNIALVPRDQMFEVRLVAGNVFIHFTNLIMYVAAANMHEFMCKVSS